MRMIREQKVVQLTSFPKLFPVNCYLVEEEDSLTLIDAALPGSAQHILKTAAGIGKPIERIVLTHGHSDHIGALSQLKSKLPDVKVYVSVRDARLLRGDRSLDESEGSNPIRGGVPKQAVLEPNVLLSDGDRIGSLLAVAAPGHTPGSMAFLDMRSGILIAGDAFQTRGGIAVSGHMKLSFPFPALATWDKRRSLESARKLCTLEPSLLAVGHGEMIAQPIEHMEKAIAEAEKRLMG